MTTRPDSPGPNLRRGPRPLLLHLSLATLRSHALANGSPNSKPGSPNWNAAEIEAAIRAALVNGGPDQTPRADAELIGGIAAYRRHEWQRDLPEPPRIWAEGGSRLLDYRLRPIEQQSGEQRPAEGPTVVFVPSLVNRAYILDLADGHSMLRWLAGEGIRPLLLDWGWPGDIERGFSLTDYVAGRLERALAAAVTLSGGPVVLVGYCMGGNLAVAAAERRPDLISGLALLATPWDFHAPDAAGAQRVAACLPLLEPALSFNGTLPVDALQTLFTSLDPFGVGEKFRAFRRLDPNSQRARLFVALEDWLNDGVPLVANVARECLGRWYGENAPARGTWRIAGLPVKPARLRLPSFVAIPRRDRIVPPESARALAQLIEGAVLHEPAAGHIGMAAGLGAERALWRPLLNWLTSLQTP